MGSGTRSPVDASAEVLRLSNAETIGCVLGGIVLEFIVDLHSRRKATMLIHAVHGYGGRHE